MKVRQICALGTVHIPRSRTLRDAAVQMRDQHVGALVVTDTAASARVIGIVTDRDIVLRAVAAGLSPDAAAVDEVMTPGVMFISGDDDLTEAMQIMSAHGVRRLAVTGKGDDVIGILSLDDVIGSLGAEWAFLTGIVSNGLEREETGDTQSPLRF